MRAAIFAMHKETAPPFSGGAPVENGAGLTLRLSLIHISEPTRPY